MSIADSGAVLQPPHSSIDPLSPEQRAALVAHYRRVHRGAFELHSWTPSASDPRRARFARIILAPTSDDGFALVKTAAAHIRTSLAAQKLEAVVGIDPNGAVLWVPFVDGPHYEPLRMWLHDVSDAAIAAHPDVFTYGHEPNRILIDVGSNATGRWSAWPYSIRGNTGLTMLTPVSWTDLAAAEVATCKQR